MPGAWIDLLSTFDKVRLENFVTSSDACFLDMNIKHLLSFFIMTLALTIGFGPSAYASDGCSAASFEVSSSLILETPPYGLATADFNGDGHLDLAATSNSSTEVVILFGRGGAESFGPPISFPAGPSPERIGVGDFNGDGKPDLVISNNTFGASTGSVSVLLNGGSGNFGAPITINLSAAPYQPVITDLNNDGKLDLVIGLYTGVTGGNIEVLLGDGAGGFSKPANPTVIANSANPSAVKVGDFNEDGKNDIALPGGSHGVDVFFGDGTGHFSSAVNAPPTNSILFALATADINGDGHLDLIGGSTFAPSSSNLYVMLGDGTGSFAAPITTNAPIYLNNIAARDLNNDGKLDLALNGLAGVKVMLGNGAGGFTGAKTYAAGPQLTAPVFGDFNEDGKVDMAVGQGLTGTFYSIELLYGDGSGAFKAPLSFSTTLSRPRELIAADFNNDGKQDFAAVSGDNNGGTVGSSSVEVALGDGSGNFTDKPLIRFFGGTLLWSIVAADFNKDGKPDLAVTLPQLGKVTILLNDGAGGFPVDGFSAPSFSTNPYGFLPTKIKSGDFNNDGNIDLVVLTPNSNNFVLMLGNGAGAFTTIQGQAEGSPTDIAVTDFNGDGILDLLTSGSSGNVYRVSMFRGTGGGNFTNINQLEFQQNYLVSILASDLNNDGKPDLAVSSGTAQNKYVTVFLNNGTGGFGPRVNYAVDGAGVLGVGDFNNDGKPDLAVASGQITIGGLLTGISILTNDGTGLFATPVSFNAGPSSDYLVVRDFNSDGKDDVLFTQPSTNSHALLLNNFSAAQQCLSVDDVTVTEGDTGTTYAVFTVKLSAASTQTVRVNYFFESPYQNEGFALKKGVDFEAVPGTLTFLPGVTTQTVTVPVKGDTVDEFDEFFNLRLSTALNAMISHGKGVGTIIDDDAQVTLSVNDVSINEGASSPRTVTFTVSLSNASEKPIQVNYLTSDGTATVSNDFDGASGTLTFPAGVTTRTVTVTINNDSTYEPDETFFLNLSNPVNTTLLDGQGQATIINDDPIPSLSIAQFSYVSESSPAGSRQATVNVTLSNRSYLPITVSFGTIDGTATAGTDYQAVAGTLTFNPGEFTLTKSFNVPANDDNVDETDETFTVKLTNPINAVLANDQGTVTIFDNDGPTVSIDDIQVTEGNSGLTDATFTVSLSAVSPQAIGVEYSTASGTAQAGLDFNGIFRQSISIPAGTQSEKITVKVKGDTINEADETFLVNLTNASNATIGDGQGIGTIVNDDGPAALPILQLNQSSYSIVEGTGSLDLLVNRSGDPAVPVTVNYATTDAANFLQNCNVINTAATSRCDYVGVLGTLHFAAGEVSKTISIPIVDDTYLEGTENLFIFLSNPTGGAVMGANQTAPISITDNSNDMSGQPNPIDDKSFFVRQHYIDFLSREPDPLSAGWVTILNGCAAGDQSCRLTVSQGIYGSPEFRDRGYFIYKFYSVSLGRKPSYDEFNLDRARVSGFQTDAELEQSKVDFISDFMARAEFANAYNGLSKDTYVQQLFTTAGVTQITVGGVVRTLSTEQQLLAGGRTRAQVLRDVAESPEVSSRFQTESTVVMHYFGYLRRDPDAAYQQWINTLNSTGDSRNVTNGFINSQEYRARFGQ